MMNKKVIFVWLICFSLQVFAVRTRNAKRELDDLNQPDLDTVLQSVKQHRRESSCQDQPEMGEFTRDCSPAVQAVRDRVINMSFHVCLELEQKKVNFCKLYELIVGSNEGYGNDIEQMMRDYVVRVRKDNNIHSEDLINLVTGYNDFKLHSKASEFDQNSLEQVLFQRLLLRRLEASSCDALPLWQDVSQRLAGFISQVKDETRRNELEAWINDRCQSCVQINCRIAKNLADEVRSVMKDFKAGRGIAEFVDNEEDDKQVWLRINLDTGQPLKEVTFIDDGKDQRDQNCVCCMYQVSNRPPDKGGSIIPGDGQRICLRHQYGRELDDRQRQIGRKSCIRGEAGKVEGRIRRHRAE